MLRLGPVFRFHKPRALLRERIEATSWFRIRMSQQQRRAAIEREVDTYWHLFVADAAERLLGPNKASLHARHYPEWSRQRKSAPQGSASKVPARGGRMGPEMTTNTLVPPWFQRE